MKHVLKLTVLSIITLTTFAAWSVTEQEYLLQNKTYTDGLVEFFKNEDKLGRQVESLKKAKKETEAQLKTQSASLASTTKKLNSEQSTLASLKDKELNKVQLEANLKSQKQQNLNKINNLEGQISNASNQLQNINFTVSQLQNEESSLINKYNTQQQVVNFAESTVRNLEDDIRQLRFTIERAQDQIQRLNNQINNLEAQKATEPDPVIQAQLQSEIQQKRNQKQNLKSDIDFAEARLNSKKLQLINAESDVSQEQNKLSTIRIQLNGKQNELRAAYAQQSQIKNEVDSLKSQKSSLVSKNSSINAELDVLANLPFYIGESQNKIQALTQQKTQQETTVNQTQAALTSVSTNLTTTQQQFETSKATVVAQEKSHDAVLKEFLTTAAVVTPTILPEGTISIDSTLATELIATSKDWSVFKGTSTTLGGGNVCVASTQVLDSVSGVISELMVVKLGDTANGYSSPFLVTTHSRIADLVVKGQLKTNSSKSILMPLLQSPVANEKALIARYSDTASLISYLKAHNTAKVEFTVPGSPVTIPFSLRGSSAMVSKMLDSCKN
jgi:myosin heavy subunit